MGVLKKHGVILIGAQPEAIEKAEDRQLFNDAMANIGLDVAKNTVVNSLEDALKALPEIGLPAIIRPSFTLGGSGGGIAHTEEEYKKIVSYGLDVSPVNEVLIDESIIGWKEYEMEVVRDKNDNAIIVCAIENLDPMGVHTGDSITVAPTLTLTDKEYQIMRNASIAVLREIGVETGGSNVQFAVNPKNGRLIVIEMNPRVSRSSALASKATGFPIAKVAAKLAVGLTLDEIQNDITQVTPASFEPVLDYIITKIPRFAFEKFNVQNPKLSTSMHSVGEVMAIGRNFAESLQKGLCSLETGLTGLNQPSTPLLNSNKDQTSTSEILESLAAMTPDKILRIALALRYNISHEEIAKQSGYSPWFIEQIDQIVQLEKQLQEQGLPQERQDLIYLKKYGFSDARIAELTGKSEKEIRHIRKTLNIHPVYKTVDTCAAEFASTTPYLYSCYEDNELNENACEAAPSDQKKIIILGSGPNRIGQGIEFDYACVHAVNAFQEEGYEAIMVNCNPETVSTDYDTANKLYFEPLTSEHVLEIIRTEQKNGQVVGVVVQFGGQTPLKLSQTLAEENIPVIGTSPDKIDLAEDRDRFQQLIQQLELRQPKATVRHHVSDIPDGIDQIGYPVVIRPSNVLGGRAMKIIYNERDLYEYIQEHQNSLTDGPILIDKFLDNAIEMDVDALCDGNDVVIGGIMQHIERAGIHSGDSACTLPSYSLSPGLIQEIKSTTVKLAKALNVVGLINVQFAIKDNLLYIIEVNPRASRTVPFVAKATGVSIAKIAAKLMTGIKLEDLDLSSLETPSLQSVKEVVLPFARFEQSEIKLDTEMRSTGEVMGVDKDLNAAFAKAQIAANNQIPLSGNVFLDVSKDNCHLAYEIIKNLSSNTMFNIYASEKTYTHINTIDTSLSQAIEKVANFENMKATPNLVISIIPDHELQRENLKIRRHAHMNSIPYVTTLEATLKCAEVMKTISSYQELDVTRIQDYAHLMPLDN